MRPIRVAMALPQLPLPIRHTRVKEDCCGVVLTDGMVSVLSSLPFLSLGWCEENSLEQSIGDEAEVTAATERKNTNRNTRILWLVLVRFLKICRSCRMNSFGGRDSTNMISQRERTDLTQDKTDFTQAKGNIKQETRIIKKLKMIES